jgi:putative DNA primase/helicase
MSNKAQAILQAFSAQGQHIYPSNLKHDYSETRRFLNLLDPDTLDFTFQTFDDNAERKNKALARISHGWLIDQLHGEVPELNAKGAGVFVAVNETDLLGRCTENIKRIRAIWQDDDEGFGGNFPLAPSIVVETSPGKFQRYWLVDGLSLEEFDHVMARMVAEYGCDRSATGCTRVLRLPGFHHRKAEPHLVRIVGVGRRYSREEILQAFPPLTVNRRLLTTPESAVELDLPENIELASQYLLERAPVAIQGQHGDDTTYRVCAAVVRDYALSELTATQLLFETWNCRCAPPWEPGEANGIEEKVSRLAQRGCLPIGNKTLQGMFGLVKPVPQSEKAAAGVAIEREQPPEGASAVHTGAIKETDLGNARRLVERHHENIRYVSERKRWLIWEGSCWKPDADGAIHRLAHETADAMFKEAARIEGDDDARARAIKFALSSQNAARLRAMVEVAATLDRVVLSESRLDANPWLLGVQNGVVDLKSGTFRPAVREDYITKTASVAFDAGVQCPKWLAFLDLVMAGDRELAAYLQRLIGYTLTGSVREEVAVLLYGTGRNGKSTFRELIYALLGDYAVCSDAGLLMAKKDGGSNATPEIAKLKGMRLVTVNETEENGRLNEQRLKFIVSNDHMTARHLYAEQFDFMPSHKAFITTNHKPVITGSDEGIWRRIHLVPFTVAIPQSEVRKDFRERMLMPEVSGILNWALAGLKAYLQVGLEPPAAVNAATKEYRQDMDIVGQWMDECCELDANARTSMRDLHLSYQGWSQGQIGWNIKVQRLGRALEDRGFQLQRGSQGRRFRIGLRLKGVWEPSVVLPFEKRETAAAKSSQAAG